MTASGGRGSYRRAGARCPAHLARCGVPGGVSGVGGAGLRPRHLLCGPGGLAR
ncbi:hypothetical protein [Amycolatopsis vancoresmycina]|uniref:hypothetical protein n=1 Tax=Amycolatopsis vancoresmycina TaxID=208444 RepID=UPI000A49B20B|nr:hypothetical protein [Amycolatopsis vancoresmycina]